MSDLLSIFFPGAYSLKTLLFSSAALATLLTLLAKSFTLFSSRKQSAEGDITDNKTIRSLPSSWYRSRDIYELERRAIFSKKWILVTHKLRFTESGVWARFEEAGFPFFLVRNKTGQINGFHNICRHRAFPVVVKEEGKSSVLACKYHGWSYGLNGQLAKAPGYTDMEGFDKTANGLFPIHVQVDAKGFIWVNLDASQTPEPFSVEFDKVDEMERHEPFNFNDYRFDHAWGMSGDYNWKTLADNYNECYHCKTAHPDVGAVADLSAYRVATKGGNIEHFAKPANEEKKDRANIVSNYYFPNACMTVSPTFFYMMRCVPTSPSHSSMEYEVYRHKDASDEDFKSIDEMFKRILSEDKWLCNNVQKNLEAGVFINGEMHSKKERGPLYFQQRIRESLERHDKIERSAKEQVYPAQQILPRGVQKTERDISLCSGLACGRNADALEW